MPLLDYLTAPRRRLGAIVTPKPSTPQGANYGGDLSGWAHRVVEKVRVATVGGRLRFLPWYDPYTEETPEIREAYRRMLVESSVKAAFQTKILSVISLDVQFQPVDDDNPREQEQAKFMGAAFQRPGCNFRHVGWSVLHPAVIDGHSVCEKVWEPAVEPTGVWKGKRFFRAIKAKDTRFLQLGIDPYRNVTAIRGMGYNAGRVWSPSDFIVFSYLSLFENPAGTSDFRSAYRPFVIKDTAWRLRSLHLENYTGPYLKGSYTNQDQKVALEDALVQAKAHTWCSLPPGVMVETIDLSMQSTTEFRDAIQDCDKEILIAIVGAHLQILEGQTTGARGNTKVHKETSELIQWFLAASLTDVYRHDLVTPLSQENYHDLPPPLVSVGAVTEEAMLESLKVDEGLQRIGLKLSKGERYRAYGRQQPAEADDVLEPMPKQQQQPAQGGDAAGASPFSEAWRRFCQEGENKGKPGPCPLPGKHEGTGQQQPVAETPGPAIHSSETLAALTKQKSIQEMVHEATPLRPGDEPAPIIATVKENGDVDEIIDGFHRLAGMLAWAKQNGKNPKKIEVDAVFLNQNDVDAGDAAEPGPRQAEAIARIYQRAGVAAHSDSFDTFCQEGENKGMPGPCPEPGKDTAGTSSSASSLLTLPANLPTSLRAKYLQQVNDPDHAELLPALRSVTGKQEPNPALAAVKDSVQPATLTQGEKVAQQLYTFGADGPLNGALRKGQPAPEAYAKTNERLQSAFAKAPVLSQPVPVTRGMDLPPEALSSFLHAAVAAQKAGEPVQLAGYTSTATGNKLAPGFTGNVEVHIAAVHGLDMMPVSHFPQEHEFLLNHNSQFRVTKVERTRKGTYKVHMEQLPPAAKSAVPVTQEQQRGKAGAPEVPAEKLSPLGKLKALFGFSEEGGRHAGR